MTVNSRDGREGGRRHQVLSAVKSTTFVLFIRVDPGL